MFSTDYNRKIAEQVNQINEDFIKHSKRVNRMGGGGLLNVADVEKTALGRPVGGNSPQYLEGGNIFKDIFHGIKSIFGGSIPDELLQDIPEGGKKKVVKKKGKGIYEEDDLMEDEPVEGGRKKYKKKGKKGGVAFPEVVEGGKKKRVKKGGNFLDDLVDDVGKVAPLLPLIALGKPKKGVKKGGILGIKAPSTFYSDKVSNNPFKGGKKTSKWIEHVKKFARDNKLKYNEALKHPKVKSSYKP
jgi:hypothetical protein